MKRYAYAASLAALFAAVHPAAAQTQPADQAQAAASAQADEGEIVVSATRRDENLQDVPLSITVFSQEEMTERGVVGIEELSREAPGVVLNQAGHNNLRFTARGISTNGWGAGLQTTTTIYLDELPLTTIGNTVTLNPHMYDVERVEVLRGPQGTLFGSGSLSGAVRILTHSPDLEQFEGSALVDVGFTPEADAVRQRYSGMVNVPLVEDRLALRAVGFFRDEDGYIDNVGTGIENANALEDWGGRAVLLWRPSERLSIRLLASHEDSQPEDASLVNPDRGELTRFSTTPDLYTSETQIYNGTVEYEFDGATLTSSTTYSEASSRFDVDLAATFGGGIPFYLRDGFEMSTLVQEIRLVSDGDNRFDWVLGAFYLDRDFELEGQNLSTPDFLSTVGITGLTDAVFSDFGNETLSSELAAFANVSYELTDALSASLGVRHARYHTKINRYAGFNSNYFTLALFNLGLPATITPVTAQTFDYPETEHTSWSASLVYEPSDDLTLYGTVSTGYRTPVFNARAGQVSIVDPTDLIIPEGADSDELTNYEIGVRGRWMDGRLNASLAAYYIDWSNVQVQANRVSDAVQFATNIDGAMSQGIEAEISFRPANGLIIGVTGALNESEVTDLTAQQAAISGAVDGARLASPRVQGVLYGSYGYTVGASAYGFTNVQIQHVGSFPNGFPNQPGSPGTPSALYDETDSYTYINAQTGVTFGDITLMLYGENLGDERAVTYVHPEAFIDSRYGELRPRTFGVRMDYRF